MAMKSVNVKTRSYINMSDDEFTKEVRAMIDQLALWEHHLVDIKLSSTFDIEGRVKRDVIYLYEEKRSK
jgi:hypothetical protein